MRDDVRLAWEKWTRVRDVKGMDIREKTRAAFEAGWLAREQKESKVKHRPKTKDEEEPSKL